MLAPNAKLRAKVAPEQAREQAHAEDVCTHSAPVRMSWARLLKRVFDIDMKRCVCGGKLKFVASIEQPDVIEKILTHLGAITPTAADCASAAGGFV